MIVFDTVSRMKGRKHTPEELEAMKGKSYKNKSYIEEGKSYCQSVNCNNRLVQHREVEMKEVDNPYLTGKTIKICPQCYNAIQKNTV